MNDVYWSLRRELWESRSIYLAPLGVAAVFLLGFAMSTFGLPARMRAALASVRMHQQDMITQPYNLAALLIMAATFLVSLLYCIDALQSERRDRSILFWKSMPVSNFTTVLAKALVPIVVLPLITFAVTFVTQLLMLLLSTLVLVANGMSIAPLWSNVSFFSVSIGLLFHLVAIHGLFYAPIFGWLLLVSAWARRVAFLWALLPPLALGAFERIVFHTSHLAAMLSSRISGNATGNPKMSMDQLMPFTPGEFLLSPTLWTGLAFTAVCVVLAARLRRNREPV
jgi:ABC-2 type transport system permease protein